MIFAHFMVSPPPNHRVSLRSMPLPMRVFPQTWVALVMGTMALLLYSSQSFCKPNENVLSFAESSLPLSPDLAWQTRDLG